MIQHLFNRVLKSRWHHGISMNGLQWRQRISKQQWGILAAAVLLHVALLALPLRRALPPAPAPPLLEVSLLAPVATLSEPPPTRLSPVTPERAPVTPPAPQGAIEHLPQSHTPAQLPEPQTAARRLTVARLLDQAARMKWPEDARPGARIARSISNKLQGELSRPILPFEPNLFDEFVLPASVEIVDRWLEPGGTHRVVVRTPSGHTVCGRQEPVDVFRPWAQMPMMFHLCAGGGKRLVARNGTPRRP